MRSLLILYSTTDGHTKKIAHFLHQQLISKQYTIEIQNIISIDETPLDKFDKIIIAASIRYGKFRKPLRQFVARNAALLNSKKSVFIPINLIARKPEKNTAETNVYTRKYLKKNVWKPDLVFVTAGMLDYAKYNFFDRNIIRLIMKITGGPTDPSVKTEFTDWGKLQRCVKEIDEL